VSYVGHVVRFVRHCQRRPEELGAEDVRRYQLHLINEKRLAPTSIVGAVAALRFLYQITLKQASAVDAIIPPKRPQSLPVVLSAEEVVRFLAGDFGSQTSDHLDDVLRRRLTAVRSPPSEGGRHR
jgi:site-specific recombinase XerD